MADRDALINTIQKSTQPPVLAEVVNGTLNAAYRVVVYRMNVSGLSVTIPNVGERSLEYLLNLDPSNEEYRPITEAIANDMNDTTFFAILDTLYGRLKEYLEGSDSSKLTYPNHIKSIYRRSNLVQEIDITALVTNITTNLDIEGLNSCAFNCVDPALISYKNTEIQRLYALNPWLKVAQNGSGNFYENSLATLKNFKFREFDLVRVFTYTSTSQTLSEKVEEIKKTVKVTGQDDLVSLLTEYSLLPAFTGFVQAINYTTAANSISTVAVQCMGTSRVLAQTSNVIDQALANQIVQKHTKLAGSIVNNRPPITPKANVFSGNTALEVFANLIDTCFYPDVYKKDPAAKNEPVAGFPSLVQLYNRTIGTDKSLNVIPLFPSLVCLHYLKEKFSELIYYCDDAILEDQQILTLMNGAIPNSYDTSKMLTALRPYMYMLKNNFELFESTYQSPFDIIGIIRSQTYMEVFEDRTGTFRFRFPKYNNAIIDNPLGPGVITSINMSRSDSNNFSVVQTRFMSDLIGAMRSVVPDVFFDGLSVLKYGFRVSATIENPNAISTTFSKFLGSFIKFYSTLRESRNAVLNIVGDAKIDLGQMVSFRYGYKSDIADIVAGYRNSGVSGNSNTFKENVGAGDYVGYVTSLSETIGAGQVFSQVLTLKFVRDAWITDAPEVATKVYGSPAMVLARSVRSLQNVVLPFLTKLFVPNGKNTFSIPVGATKTGYPLTGYYVFDSYAGAFEPVPSSLDLANQYLSAKQTIDDETAQAKNLLEEKRPPTTKEQYLSDIVDLEKQIDAVYRIIGMMEHKSSYLVKLGASINTTFKDSSLQILPFISSSTVSTGDKSQEWLASGWEKLRAKLAKLNADAYNTAYYNPKITISNLPYDYRGKYGSRNVSITKKDYYPTVDQMLFVAQTAHNRLEKKYNFKNDFTAILSEPYNPKDKSQKSRWNELWRAFEAALAFQEATYQKSGIPFYERFIQDAVASISNYNTKIKQLTNNVVNAKGK